MSTPRTRETGHLLSAATYRKRAADHLLAAVIERSYESDTIRRLAEVAAEAELNAARLAYALAEQQHLDAQRDAKRDQETVQ